MLATAAWCFLSRACKAAAYSLRTVCSCNHASDQMIECRLAAKLDLR